MADIFISYKREDREWAEALSKALEAMGWSTWWDTRLHAGESFNAKIQDELDDARCVIVLWSKLSVKSRWVIDEANEGLERDILLPLMLDARKPPLGFRGIHATEIKGWDKKTTTGPFEQVVRDLTRLLGNPPAAAAREVKPSVRSEAKQRSTGARNAGEARQASPPKEKPPRSFTNNLGMDFIGIEAGSFMMGSNKGEPREQPVHRVEITRPFYLGVTPITQGQWEQVMGDNPSAFKQGANHPVENVSWRRVQEFVEALNRREQRSHYRLPTEAEWEYACRAGTTTEYSFGDDEEQLGEYAWYSDWPGGSTHPVGQKKPNIWGLYDMHGNVWEWVQDWYAEDYYKQFQSKTAIDPRGPKQGTYRVIRGGSWNNYATYLRSAYRDDRPPGNAYDYVGFRLLRTIP